MNFKEACTTLGIETSATADEAKKSFRQLSKKLHPDNKETGDEDKFKKINEAYQRFQEGDKPEAPAMPGGWYRNQGGINIHSPFRRQVMIESENIELNTTISFKESVLGVKKEMKFKRYTKCVACEGQGEAVLNNGCKNCGGRGQVTGRQGNMIFSRTCHVCHGQVQTEQCKECKGNCVIEADVSVHVSVPGGVQTGNTLRLQGMGHYTTNFMGMDQHTDAFLHITVTPESGLSLAGKDVVSTLKISLLDALRGCNRDVKTIEGKKEVEVKALSRNKDEIIIPRLGVNGEGSHRIILDVQYPKDTTKLVGVLVDEVK